MTIHRRDVLKLGALLAMTPAARELPHDLRAEPPRGAGDMDLDVDLDVELEETSIVELRAAMEAGRATSEQLVAGYVARVERIDRAGPTLKAVLEINPDATAIARGLDEERRAGRVRGPLHGIPILLKDNVDTADRMETTAGSLALLGSRPPRDATVAARLREAGAVLLGKTNLSEWANFRSTRSSSGWSGRGGQTRNPYGLDYTPCGSSSGSAVAAAASLCAAAIGTETDGSVVCPSAASAVVGIKPTVGLTSRAGVIPISHSQDTVGVHARTVTEAAMVLGAITSVAADPRDAATARAVGKARADYTPFLKADGLKGARIGVPRKAYYGYHPPTDAVMEEALRAMKAAGAVLVDPADIPTAQRMASGSEELDVLLYEFKADLRDYLAERKHPGIATLADLIAFNRAHAAEEMPYFGQELFEQAQKKGPLTDPKYRTALATSRRLSRAEGIDAVMTTHRLDALVAPTGGPPWKIDLVSGDHFLGASSTPAAMAGYPAINVPAGYVHGLPVGLTFFGRAWSEPTLITLAYAFEQATNPRRKPEYRATLP